MTTSYQRLRERVEAAEVETGELRKAIATAVEEGTIHPAGAGAELIARAIRGGNYEIIDYDGVQKYVERSEGDFRKSVEKVGHTLPGIFGENLGDRESVKKLKKSREAGGNPLNWF